MTKEELYKLVESFIYDGGLNYRFHGIIDGLDEFFSQNVVIHKGENRHPYADVLHGWIEGANIEVNDLFNIEVFIAHTDAIRTLPNKYRIKTQEPVYEWQWEFTYNGLICRTGFYTYEQIKAYMYNIKVTKIEETKRERK